MKSILYAIAFACAIYAGASDLFAATPVYRDYSVTVAQGDTLWDIACRHAEGKEDVRLVMERIAKANKLDVGHIYPGQVIKVPLRIKDSGLMIATK